MLYIIVGVAGDDDVNDVMIANEDWAKEACSNAKSEAVNAHSTRVLEGAQDAAQGYELTAEVWEKEWTRSAQADIALFAYKVDTYEDAEKLARHIYENVIDANKQITVFTSNEDWGDVLDTDIDDN